MPAGIWCLKIVWPLWKERGKRREKGEGREKEEGREIEKERKKEELE